MIWPSFLSKKFHRLTFPRVFHLSVFLNLAQLIANCIYLIGRCTSINILISDGYFCLTIESENNFFCWAHWFVIVCTVVWFSFYYRSVWIGLYLMLWYYISFETIIEQFLVTVIVSRLILRYIVFYQNINE